MDFNQFVVENLNKLSEKVDNLAERLAYHEGGEVNKRLDNINQKLDDLSVKVHGIETKQKVIYGVAAGCAAIGAFIMGIAKFAIAYIVTFFAGR